MLSFKSLWKNEILFNYCCNAIKMRKKDRYKIWDKFSDLIKRHFTIIEQKRSLNKIHLSWKTMFFFADEIWDNRFILNIKYSQPTLFCRGMNHFHYNCCLFRINILCSQNFRCKHASCAQSSFSFLRLHREIETEFDHYSR